MIPHDVYIPGVSSDELVLDMGVSEYTINLPGTWEILDFASGYRWRDLVPGQLSKRSKRRMEDDLLDPEHPLTWFRLHVVMQRVGTYLYGWPYFMAARAWSTVEYYWTYFRTWMLTNCTLRPETPADWVCLAVAFFLESSGKPDDRKSTWAQLTIPHGLSDSLPGVLPDWLSA